MPMSRSLIRAVEGIQTILEARSAVALFATAALLLVLMVPPTGILSGNEEHYLALALQIFNADALPRETVFLGGTPHAFLFGWLFGPIVDALGYAPAQVIGRISVIILGSLALARLFGVLRLSAADLALVLIAFYAAGEALFGAEWIFRSIEPKALAYPLVLGAIAELLTGRLGRCFALLIVATYFHVLAGGLWALIIGIYLLLFGPGWREILKPASAYALSVLPLAAYLAFSGYAQTGGAPDAGAPSTAWIYTFVMMPFHTTPFGNIWDLLAWAPGIGATAAICVAALLMPAQAPIEQAIARLVVVALAFVLLALAATFFDDAGQLGPFLLFRPTSLALLLALTGAALVLRSVSEPTQRWARHATLLVLLGTTAPALALGLVQPVHEHAKREGSQREMIDYVRANTPAGSRFLIAASEQYFYDFERLTGRAVLVMTKFAPVRKHDIHEWYRRYEFRRSVLRNGCQADAEYSPTHILAYSEQAQRLTGSCGPVVFDDGRLAVMRYETGGQRTAAR